MMASQRAANRFDAPRSGALQILRPCLAAVYPQFRQLFRTAEGRHEQPEGDWGTPTPPRRGPHCGLCGLIYACAESQLIRTVTASLRNKFLLAFSPWHAAFCPLTMLASTPFWSRLMSSRRLAGISVLAISCFFTVSSRSFSFGQSPKDNAKIPVDQEDKKDHAIRLKGVLRVPKPRGGFLDKPIEMDPGLRIQDVDISEIANQVGADSQKSGTETAEAAKRYRHFHSNVEIALTIGILIFGTLLMGFEMLLVFKQPGWSTDATLKLLGLTLVVTAGLFLIVAGFDQIQIASMMGLLGSLAGYLLGKEHSQPSPETPKQPPAPAGG